jgi:hypothetical protein
MRLNELLNFHKNNNLRSGEAPPQVDKFHWATSNIVLMFLENAIKKYTKRPIFTEDNPVVPLTF